MLVDVLILALAVFALIRGREIGFSHQLLATVGFFGGLAIGIVLEPFVVDLFHSSALRTIAAVTTVLGFGLLALLIGESSGLRIKHHISQRKVNTLDNALGAVLSLVTLFLGLWLSAALLSNLPYKTVQSQIDSSKILHVISISFPNAPSVITSIGRFVDPNGFPQVFLGDEPAPQSTLSLPDLGSLKHAVNKDRLSVVRIEGRGCGGIVEGSGFIVSKDLVMTNAHVVAGINKPEVQDSTGSHKGTVVYFDPKLDLAILRVSGLTATPLSFAGNTATANTPAAVLGYPGGGSFNAQSAVITRTINASGKDIYGKTETIRTIYEFGGDVRSGNSGGPIINEQGDVVGVVFAESSAYEHIGYALAAPKVVAALQHVTSTSPSQTSSGKCAS